MDYVAPGNYPDARHAESLPGGAGGPARPGAQGELPRGRKAHLRGPGPGGGVEEGANSPPGGELSPPRT